MSLSTKSAPIRIAIVGGGFSGTMMAVLLLRQHFDQPVHLVLVERREKVGNGIAYSTMNDLHLLNVYAGGMSALAEDADHFLRYMQGRDKSVVWETFCRRRDFGVYLGDMLKEACEKADAHVTYECVRDSVNGITKSDGSPAYTLHCQSDRTLVADIVVLAIGNFKGADPLKKWEGKFDSDRYIEDPWVTPRISAIKKDEHVLFIGSGLTMVDKALEIHANGHTGALIALSRRGLLPQDHKEAHLRVLPRLESQCAEILPMNLAEALRFVRKRCDEENWRDVVNALRTHCQKWWQQLKPRDQKRYMRHLGAYWDVHRHRMAPNVAAHIHELLDSSLLHIVAGRIVSVEQEGDTIHVKYRPKGDPSGLNQVSAQRIINCTGTGLSLNHISDPLLSDLARAGLISEYVSGGLNVTPDFCLINRDGQKVEGLYASGSLLRGVLFESIAVPELKKQSDQIAHSIVSSLKTRAPSPTG
jgi:uncharacterized NAD(P)/FAD-binding protein YdhS